MSKKTTTTTTKKLTSAQVKKDRDGRQTALMERRVGASLSALAAVFAASRPKKKASSNDV